MLVLKHRGAAEGRGRNGALLPLACSRPVLRSAQTQSELQPLEQKRFRSQMVALPTSKRAKWSINRSVGLETSSRPQKNEQRPLEVMRLRDLFNNINNTVNYSQFIQRKTEKLLGLTKKTDCWSNANVRLS